MTAARDPGAWALALALACAILAATGPRWSRPLDLRDLLVIVDITRSMTVRDMGDAARPVGRLDQAKALLPRVLAGLPCGSRVGLGIFTERRSLTLVEPVEVCANFAALDGSLAALDWRMAWEGDSHVARCLYHALGADLVFLTGGHEAPPLPYSGTPDDRGTSGAVRGLIVGVGGTTPAPIPKTDDLGRPDGFYGAADVQHAPSRVGPPPADAATRPGHHVRDNPYGEADLAGAEHLSARRHDHLAARAARLGLGLTTLGPTPGPLLADIQRHTRARPMVAPVDAAWAPAGLALAAVLAAHALAARPAPLIPPGRTPWLSAP